MACNIQSLLKKAMIIITAANLIQRRCGGVNAFRAATIAATRLTPLPTRTVGAFRRRTANNNDNNIVIQSSSSHSRFSGTRLRDQNGDGDNGNNEEVEPTWNYVPYQQPPAKRKPPRRPPNNARRNFSSSESPSSSSSSSSSSSWEVPDKIAIPEDQLQISFSRASGAGGQNVNKVNTKVELRFHVDSAAWLPPEVRRRFGANEGNRINGEGYFTVTSQENRTQIANRKDAVRKLRDMIRDSWARPKVRRMRKGLTKFAKEHRRENKKKNSMKKENRKRVDF